MIPARDRPPNFSVRDTVGPLNDYGEFQQAEQFRP